MTRLQQLVPWALLLAGLVPALLWTALLSLFAFYRDGTGLAEPPVIPPRELISSAVLISPPAVCVAAVAAAIGLRSGARWATPLAFGVSGLLLVGSVLGLAAPFGQGSLGALLGPASFFVAHLFGPGVLFPITLWQGPLAGLALSGVLAGRRAAQTDPSSSSVSYSPRRIERWIAALLVGSALEHAVLAVAMLIRGVTGFEGAIVLSAPVYVIAEFGIASGVLRRRRWARPALVVVAVPVLAWTYYISGIVAGMAVRPGVDYRLQQMGILAGLLAIGAFVGAFVLRRTTER
jgi:hypothetical protein